MPSSLLGYCAVTQPDQAPTVRCIGRQGSWRGHASLSSCVAACNECSACNFVSFSIQSDDCSWFRSCETPLQRWHGGDTYQTVAVRNEPFLNVSYQAPAWKASRKQRRQPVAWCGDASLRRRSYLLPAPWPYTVRTRMVMEHAPGSCDFYKDTSFCASRAAHPALEPHVLEALASALVGSCRAVRGGCRAVDLGANNGWITLRMLALGANVTAVEPQADLAQAVHDSADRLSVLTGYVESAPLAREVMRPGLGYRVGGRPARLSLPDVPVLSLDAVLEQAAGRRPGRRPGRWPGRQQGRQRCLWR